MVVRDRTFDLASVVEYANFSATKFRAVLRIFDGTLPRVFARPVRSDARRFKTLPPASIWPNLDDGRVLLHRTS